MSSNILTTSINRCFLAVGYQRIRKDSNRKQCISQELGSVGVPPLDGGRFRRMADMFLLWLAGWDSKEIRWSFVLSKTHRHEAAVHAGISASAGVLTLF